MTSARLDKRSWLRLRLAAEEEVKRLLHALPREVRDKVAGLPIVCEPVPTEDMVADGIESDLLGLFVGDAFDETGQDALPPEILLFLNNIWEDVGHDTEAYRLEVRRTLLHEIGHYLGLEEDDLVVRDLE